MGFENSSQLRVSFYLKAWLTCSNSAILTGSFLFPQSL